MDDLLKMEELKKYYSAPSHRDIAIEFKEFTGAWDVVEKKVC